MLSTYSRDDYQFPEGFLRRVTTLRPARTLLAIAGAWGSLLLVLLGSQWACAHEPWLYPVCLFVIAGRQGVLLQLLHECSHRLVSNSRKLNLWVARWICAYPIGLCADGYIQAHLQHHGNANTEQDPISDREKYREVDFSRLRIYGFLLKDLVGITAFQIFFLYRGYSEGERQEQGRGQGRGIRSLLCTSVWQILLIATVFKLNVGSYLLFWIFPAISAHMFLMRIRGIAEHGLPNQLGVKITRARDGERLTRSFLTPQACYRFAPAVWLEKLLIGSLSVHYHHEHHLMPNVPFYHLKELHSVLGPQVRAQNPDVYASGYLSAALKNLLDKKVESPLRFDWARG